MSSIQCVITAVVIKLHM